MVSLALGTVLCLTHKGDHYTIDRVMSELSTRGFTPVRIDIERFPEQLRLSAMLAGGGRIALKCSDSPRCDFREVHGVWVRRLWSPTISAEVDPQLKNVSLRESVAARMAWIEAIHANVWVNRPACDARAANKLLQLEQATALHLTIPETLISNDPDEVRRFYEVHDGDIVAKMLTPFSTSMSGEGRFVYTTKVDGEHLSRLEDLSASPTVFQRRVPKAFDVRAVIVGDRVLACSLTTRNSDPAVDCRRIRPDDLEMKIITLPPSVCKGLISLVSSLDLVYGAADLIVTPAGEYVFLEVNPGGEWGMLEKRARLPVAAAIADAFAESL